MKSKYKEGNLVIVNPTKKDCFDKFVGHIAGKSKFNERLIIVKDLGGRSWEVKLNQCSIIP